VQFVLLFIFLLSHETHLLHRRYLRCQAQYVTKLIVHIRAPFQPFCMVSDTVLNGGMAQSVSLHQIQLTMQSNLNKNDRNGSYPKRRICSKMPKHELKVPTDRIETLTDGIFAIAMTLLVLSIEVPTLQPP